MLYDHDPEKIDFVDAAYRRHRGDVYRYLLQRTGSWDDAEELTQATFADAAAALPRLEHKPDSVIAWLYTVAERRFIDEVRKRARRRQRVHLLYQTEAIEPPQYGPAAANALRRAIAVLPPEQRAVIVMRLLDDRPFAEIAAELDTTEAACKMRFARGLAAIRSRLTEEGMEP